MNMNRFTFSLALLLKAGSSAFAHDGPRVWIANDAGTIRTYTSDDDLEPSVYSPARVFSVTLPQFFGVYTTEFPGYEVRRDGGNVSADTLFGFKVAGPLLMFDPAQNRLRPTSQIFTTTPAPQLGVSLASTTLITNTGVQDGYNFFNFGGIGDHAHLSYTLLGDGSSPTANSPDGVYVLPMILNSPSLTRSNWYLLVLDKNGIQTQIDQSKTLAQTMADARAGDVNFDGRTNFDDLLTLAQNYGSSTGKWWANGDFDFDGDVDFDDLLNLAQNYGAGSPGTCNLDSDWLHAQALAPEPSGFVALPILSVLMRRKR